MERITTAALTYLNQLPTPWQWLTKDNDVTHDAELEIEALGRIRGKKFTFANGRRVAAYLGVPYAKAGGFQDRFKKPTPVEPWTDVRDCTQFGPLGQDEQNCLHMNIFVPENGKKDMPVMVFHSSWSPSVYIHGGGFLIHSSANYGDRQICRNLCAHDVIVCVVQYRLGLLGFLSTGTKECPGNFGLWDLREALLFIRDRIHNFGGDGANITALPGGACCDLLSLSPKCEGLLKRVVLMGGNAASDWAVVSPQRTINAAVEVAKRQGWKGDPKDHEDLLRFLRQLTPHRCKAAIVGKSAFDRKKKGLDLCPVIDGDFLPLPVHELRKRASPITALIGTTDFESLLFVALGRSQSDLASFEKTLALHIPEGIPESEELREEGPPVAYSDCLMNNCTHRYVEEMCSRHTVYCYNITYCNPNSFGLFALRAPFVAATHCQDLRYLFGKGMFAKFRPNDDDLKVLDYMTTMWTNFAKTGNPNYDPSIEFSSTTTRGRRAEFWKKLDAYREADPNDLGLDTGPVELD
ncbi:COesterase domain-containing protein [Aphelenchoides fujianensis]|nr:COesterase domain-containing protein [Aphelenchoides fujianensis]